MLRMVSSLAVLVDFYKQCNAARSSVQPLIPNSFAKPYDKPDVQHVGAGWLHKRNPVQTRRRGPSLPRSATYVPRWGRDARQGNERSIHVLVGLLPPFVADKINITDWMKGARFFIHAPRMGRR